MKKARELLTLIRDMPGKKVVTLSILLDDETSDFVFDVSETGSVGYHRDHRKQLLTLLDYGIHNSGGLIIRQFTNLSYEGRSADGDVVRFPYKLIYAIFLGNGDTAGVHHPAYDFNDEATPYGVSLWAKIIESGMPAR